MAGYSGTPLVKKLGIQEGNRLFLVDAPEKYLQWIAPLPKAIKISPRLSSATDFVHLFCTEKTKLQKLLRTCLTKLKPDGVIWISWPKKVSKVTTDITEDSIREVALPMGLVDIKVFAVDEVWSGLKLVIRQENRKPIATARARAKSTRK